MPLVLGSRSLAHVAVIGSGQIGPDIALHFAKVMAPLGGRVTVVDVKAEALAAGKARCGKKIAKGVETNAWKQAEADAMLAALAFTDDYSQIAGAGLVVEAATEDEGLKGRIFRQIEGLVAADAVLLSNSSHLEPERIFAPLQHKSRTAVAHYFFPAERNPMVEIVPGADTAPEVTAWLLHFYEQIGKLPVQVGSRYGYAADPIFEGIFAAACLAVEAGLGSIKEVDWVARAALGMTVGPFTAMNLTGGNPITEHGLDLMHERLGPWFRAPQLLKDRLAAGNAPWEVCGRGEKVELPAEQTARITDTLRGAYLGICFGILDAGIIAPNDFELLVETALDMRGPHALVNQLGVRDALALVMSYVRQYPDMRTPESLARQAASNQPFVISPLVETKLATEAGTVRVVRIRRPKVLNALDHATYGALLDAIARLQTDADAIGMVISGFGTKAFVSGADIHALAAVRTPDDGYAIAKVAHDVAAAIGRSPKPVVAALNGIAFGGGLELALGCHARVAAAGLKVLAGLPEVNLGIIPAGGGTQRLPRLIGLERATQILRTGGSVGSDEALKLGLVQALAPAAEVVLRGATYVGEIAQGKAPIALPSEAPLAAEAPVLPEVDIGHRSQAVDGLLQDSIRYGATHDLATGLTHELEVFRRICALEDMRIGVENFVQNGPRTPANFVHR